MCGIAGVVHVGGQPTAQPVLQRMADAMAHRGPDGEGYFVDGSVGLCHRRLAIIDLSSAGRQPMASETGDVVVTYNGEIYNFRELRVELQGKGHRFHSNTDTEVIVHGYEEWGEGLLLRLNGMFAFAVLDRSRKRLLLARDRFGVKPLYYYRAGELLLFASEVKAILAHRGARVSVCYPALNEYFTFQNILSDRTLFEGVLLLPPGHSLTIDLLSHQVAVSQYWDYSFSRKAPRLTFEEAAEELHRLFLQAVTRQLGSDVPVGAYLSGGMDSGSITAVARGQLGRLFTFTGGFDMSSASGLELGFDERASSEVLANALKTEHYEMVMHAGDMEHVMPSLIRHLEDLRVGQCYPNYYIARLASKFVKVVLSGAGGDELFGGYPWRYFRGLNHNGNGGDCYWHYYQFWQRLVTDGDKPELFTDSTHRKVGDQPAFDVFRRVLGDGWELETPADFVNAALYFELKTFLHGLLVVEDKLSMAHSLETRVPFLDNDLADFACSLPAAYKIRDLGQVFRLDENAQGKYHLAEATSGDGKMVLRHAMRRLIPPEVTDRAKQGFSAPDASWFRGESIEYINNLLGDPRARIYDFLQPSYVQRRIDEHKSGLHNHRLFIWSVLSFEWWLRTFSV